MTPEPTSRASPAVATVATLTMLVGAVALMILEAYPPRVDQPALRFSPLQPVWLVACAGLCWVAARVRFAWFFAVPLVVALIASVAKLRGVAQIASNGVLVASLLLVLRSKYFDSRHGRLTAPFLAATSGWASALALWTAIVADKGPSGGWLAPAVATPFAIGWGVWALTRKDEVLEGSDPRPSLGRAYFRGFFTLFSIFLAALAVMLVAAAIAYPFAGANSGSAGPNSWQTP
jgi:hypothetical protein